MRIIAGRQGTMSPGDLRRMGKLTALAGRQHRRKPPGVYDDQERYFREVVKFKDVEAGKLK
jgi:hypothetical protein